MSRLKPARKRPSGEKPHPPAASTSTQLEPDEGLTVAQLAFIHEYDANGGNGTRAYLAAHPAAGMKTAAANAYKLLRKTQIRQKIAELAEARWKRLEMSGDEAAALVACDARADIRELYDDHGKILPVHLWPDSVARSVKAFRTSPKGESVVLNDSLAARRLVLEQTGKLKSALTPAADLATILAEKFKDGE